MADLIDISERFAEATKAQKGVLAKIFGSDVSPFHVIPANGLNSSSISGAGKEIAKFIDNAPDVIRELNAMGATNLAKDVEEITSQINKAQDVKNFDFYVGKGRQAYHAEDAVKEIDKLLIDSKFSAQKQALTRALEDFAKNPSEKAAAEAVARATRELSEKAGGEVTQSVVAALKPLAENVPSEALKEAVNVVPKVVIDPSKIPSAVNPDYRGAIKVGETGAIRDILVTASVNTLPDGEKGEAFRRAVDAVISQHSVDGKLAASSMHTVQAEIESKAIANARAMDPNVDEKFFREQMQGTFKEAGETYAKSVKSALEQVGENGKAIAAHIHTKGTIADVADNLTQITQGAEKTGQKLGLEAAREAIDVASVGVGANRVMTATADIAEHSVKTAMLRLFEKGAKLIPLAGAAFAGSYAAATAAEATTIEARLMKRN
jgi:hypothetical protein